jgi:hypothetical protein
MQAQRLLLNRLRPPLSAAPSVWKRRQTPVHMLGPGSWAGEQHLVAAKAERGFWRHVSVYRRMLVGGEGGGM